MYCMYATLNVLHFTCTYIIFMQSEVSKVSTPSPPPPPPPSLPPAPPEDDEIYDTGGEHVVSLVI